MKGINAQLFVRLGLADALQARVVASGGGPYGDAWTMKTENDLRAMITLVQQLNTRLDDVVAFIVSADGLDCLTQKGALE